MRVISTFLGVAISRGHYCRWEAPTPPSPLRPDYWNSSSQLYIFSFLNIISLFSNVSISFLKAILEGGTIPPILHIRPQYWHISVHTYIFSLKICIPALKLYFKYFPFWYQTQNYHRTTHDGMFQIFVNIRQKYSQTTQMMNIYLTWKNVPSRLCPSLSHNAGVSESKYLKVFASLILNLEINLKIHSWEKSNKSLKLTSYRSILNSIHAKVETLLSCWHSSIEIAHT